MDIKPLVLVLLITLAHMLIINTGIFDSVTAELGYHMYAEKPDSIPAIPLKMPFNTIVNFGYYFVGGYWYSVFTTKHADFHGEMYCWYSRIYCYIQLYRIVYQTQRSAVLDQWITPTMFCHVLLWITSVECEGRVTRIVRKFDQKAVFFLSFIGYGLSLTSDIGFEIDLGIHILLTIAVGYEAQISRGDAVSKRIFLYCLACCVGFVVLKLADLPLKEYWYPNCLSGHFLSKICDIGQIYYAAALVERLNHNNKSKSS